MHITHKILPIRMHNVEDMITSYDDDPLNISVPTYIDKKGDYELSRDACVVSFVYKLKFL
jgi:hypothetical protein